MSGKVAGASSVSSPAWGAAGAGIMKPPPPDDGGGDEAQVSATAMLAEVQGLAGNVEKVGSRALRTPPRA